MSPRLQQLAAAHGGLWDSDPWYRRAWFIWPQAAALVIAGSLVLSGASPNPQATAPWGTPEYSALAPEEADALRDRAKTDVTAFEKLKDLATTGDANAEFDLGTLYDPAFHFSSLVPPDAQAALSWYTKAAEQGAPVAQYNVGWAFYSGEWGLAKDFPRAAFWLEKSAAQGYAKAELELGYCYENGTGVAVDPAHAIRLFYDAANKGEAAAQFEMGFAYDHGNGGLHVDPNEAFNWYQKGAASGNIYAMNNLGIAYATGRGVAQNLFLAREWFTRASASGNRDAANNLLKMPH